jgi:hypothetical protein
MWENPRGLAPWDRGLLRLTGEPRSSFLWKHDEAIGWRSGPWQAIYERRSVLSLELFRMLPARGGGYSQLSVKLRNPFSLEQEPVESVVLRGKAAGDLDGMAAKAAALWGLPVNTLEDMDC